MDQKPWAGLGGTTSTAVKKIKLTENKSDVFMSTKWRQLKAPRSLPIAINSSKILLMISIRLLGSQRVSLNWFMPQRTKFSFVIHVKASTRRLLWPWKIRANKFITSSLILSIGVDLLPWLKIRFRSLIFGRVTKFCSASRARRNSFKRKDKEEIWVHMDKLFQVSIGASIVRTWSSHIQNEATMQGSGIW